MADNTYTAQQTAVIDAPLSGSLFLSGPAGSGKTTSAIGRLERLLAQVPGHQILVLVPQRSLGLPYQKFLQGHHNFRGSLPSIVTLGGLARRLTGMFWPLVGTHAGFLAPHLPPQFLSLETAQYVMSRIVDPKLEKGYFNSVTIDKNRLYSQIIDNLNKAAVVRFPLTEIAQRLKSDQNLDPAMLDEVTGGLAVREVAVVMPPFEFTTDYSLSPALSDMGMADAFDPSRADFSGFTGARDLFITAVVHKAFVKVDETGTEAAAATGVIMATSAMPSDPPELFLLDRPFVFIIIDDLSDTVLFMGRVTDPSL